MPPYNSQALANLIVQGGQRRGQQAAAPRRALGQFVGALGQQASQLTGQIMQDRREGPLRQQMGLSQLMKSQLEIDNLQSTIEDRTARLGLEERRLTNAEEDADLQRSATELNIMGAERSMLASFVSGVARMDPETQDQMMPGLQRMVNQVAEKGGHDPINFAEMEPGMQRSQQMQFLGYSLDSSLFPKTLAAGMLDFLPGSEHYNQLLQLQAMTDNGKATFTQGTVNSRSPSGEVIPRAEMRFLNSQTGMAEGGPGVPPIPYGCDPKVHGPDLIDCFQGLKPAAIRSQDLMQREYNHMGQALARGMIDLSDPRFLGRNAMSNIKLWNAANKSSIEEGFGAFDAMSMQRYQTALKDTDSFLNSSGALQMMAQAETMHEQANMMREFLLRVERTNVPLWNAIKNVGFEQTALGETPEGLEWIGLQKSVVQAVDTLASLISPGQQITAPAWKQALLMLRSFGGSQASIAALDVIQADTNKRIQAWHNVRPALTNFQMKDPRLGPNGETRQIMSSDLFTRQKQEFAQQFIENNPGVIERSMGDTPLWWRERTVPEGMQDQMGDNILYETPVSYPEPRETAVQQQTVTAQERSEYITEQPVVGKTIYKIYMEDPSRNAYSDEFYNTLAECQAVGAGHCFAVTTRMEKVGQNMLTYEDFNLNQNFPAWLTDPD